MMSVFQLTPPASGPVPLIHVPPRGGLGVSVRVTVSR